MTNEAASGLTLLRTPFPPHQISKLPKPKTRDAPKGRCPECGGWHGLPAVHLDYVGHAALTDRLLDADPSWTWEPMSVGPEGLPALDGYGGMWIRLTVCGVTRLGYGHAGEKQGGDAIKEVIGDALRNAAMRFGAALDLWHKGDLHADDKEDLTGVLQESIEHEQAKRTGALAAAAADAAANIEPKVRAAIASLSGKVTEAFGSSPAEAFDLIEDQGLNGDEKTYLWSHLDSKVRSGLKREGQIRAMKGVPA